MRPLLTYNFAAQAVIAAVLAQNVLKPLWFLKRLKSRNLIAGHVEEAAGSVVEALKLEARSRTIR